MNLTPITLKIAIAALPGLGSADINPLQAVGPSQLKRWTISDVFDKDATVLVSSLEGPKKDGAIEFIDAIEIDATDIDGARRAFFVRFQEVDGDIGEDTPAKNLGTAAKHYLETHGTPEVATDAIDDMYCGKDLYGRWQSAFVIERDDGTFKAIDHGDTSLQIQKDGKFALQRGVRMGSFDRKVIFRLLMRGPDTVEHALANAYKLGDTGDKTYYLVRAPIDTDSKVAFAVVDATDRKMWLYDDGFRVVAYRNMATDKGFVTVMPAIDDTGKRTGKVTTVAGKGDDWKTDIGIPAHTLGDDAFAQAFATT